MLMFSAFFKSNSEVANIVKEIILTLLDGWSTLSIALMFVVLYRPTVSLDTNTHLDLYKLSSASSMWILAVGLSVMLGICSKVYLLSSWLTYIIILFSVIVSSVALGSLSGRLTSKFLSVPPLIITMLFLYAGLQMHNPQTIISLFTKTKDYQKEATILSNNSKNVREINPGYYNTVSIITERQTYAKIDEQNKEAIFNLKVPTYILSGILKSILFLVITWTLFTGRMHLYLLQTRLLNTKIEETITVLNRFPIKPDSPKQ
jgi:hypothetical protein